MDKRHQQHDYSKKKTLILGKRSKKQRVPHAKKTVQLNTIETEHPKPRQPILLSQYPDLAGEFNLDDAVKWWNNTYHLNIKQLGDDVNVSISIQDEEDAYVPDNENDKNGNDDTIDIGGTIDSDTTDTAYPKPGSMLMLPAPAEVASARLPARSVFVDGVTAATSVIAVDRKRLDKRALKYLSNVLISLSMFGVLFFSAPFLALELRAAVFKITSAILPQAVTIPEAQLSQQNQQVPSLPMPSPTPEVVPPLEDRFRIVIPKIGVDSQVVANVDAANQTEYTTALKQGVAHAKGTGLPGGTEENAENKSIFIFAHSTNGAWNITRYNALFYSLKDMEPDDELSIVFWGKKYDYVVKEKKVVEASDTSFLMPQNEKEVLVLQTCWPPGTTWKRLVVVAERK